MGSLTLAVLKVRQDFLSSSGGRVPHSLFKIIMKVTLLAAVVFLVYVMSGLTDASGGEAKGPVVTHVVEFEVSREGENLHHPNRPLRQDCSKECEKLLRTGQPGST